MPLVDAVTSRSPVRELQVTSNGTSAVCPKATVAVRGFSPSTLQLFASPVSWNWWSPSASPVKVTSPSAAMDWLGPSASGSTVTV